MSRAASHHRVNDGAKGTQGRGFFARAVRRSAVVLILAWLALAVVSNLAVPSLEQVAKEHAVSLSIQDAPAMKARNHIGAVFDEPAGDGMAMVVLDSEQPLGDAAHQYYDELVRQFNDEKTHVLRVQDFWGDPMTAQAVQSGVRPGFSRRQPGRESGERVRRGPSQDRRTNSCAGRSQGLRHRSDAPLGRSCPHR